MAVELLEPFSLCGEEVELEQAEALKTAGFALVDAQSDAVTVDLGGLNQANSITVALMVAWYRRATLQQKSIKFENLSQDLHNIIEFSGLSRVLLSDVT